MADQQQSKEDEAVKAVEVVEVVEVVGVVEAVELEFPHAPTYTDTEKKLIKAILGPQEESDTWEDEAYREYFSDVHARQMVSSLNAEDEQAKLGGLEVTERWDELYLDFCSSRITNPDSFGKEADQRIEADTKQLKFLKLLNGLHRTPAIPCRTVPSPAPVPVPKADEESRSPVEGEEVDGAEGAVGASGVVSIDIEATRAFLQAYFDLPCSLKVPTTQSGGLCAHGIPFEFSDEDGEEKHYNEAVANLHSLTAFRSSHLALRRPLFASGTPLPAPRPAWAATVDAPCPTLEKTLTYLVEDFQGIIDTYCRDDSRLQLTRDSSMTLYQRAEILQLDNDTEGVGLPYCVRKPEWDSGCGRGNGGQGIRKRVRKLPGRGQKEGYSPLALDRLVRRAGAPWASAQCYGAMTESLETYLNNVLSDAISVAAVRRSSIIGVTDVITARPGGKVVLGFGGACCISVIWSDAIARVLAQVHPNVQVDPRALSVLNDIVTYVLDKLLGHAIEARSRQHVASADPRVEHDEYGRDVEDRAFGYLDVRVGDDDEELDFKGEHSVRLYLRHDQNPPGAVKLATPVACITREDVQNAVRVLLPGELAKHAVSEGTKAVTKFVSTGPNTKCFQNMSSRCGLQLDPAYTALVASRLTRDFPLSENAAVYLSAVLEYMTAELLELSGNECRNVKSCLIGCLHVSRAIAGDQELEGFFKDCVIRGAGVQPNIHPSLLEPSGFAAAAAAAAAAADDDDDGDEKTQKTFIGRMASRAREVARAQGLPFAVFVDPRTGLHMGCRDEGDNEYEMEGEFLEVQPLPVLDALCRENITERRQLAEAALSEADKALMRAEGFCLLAADVDGADQERAWAEEKVLHAHNRRLAEVRAEQLTNSFALPLDVFGRHIRELASEYKQNLAFTAEASECLQTCAEHFLLTLAQDAQEIAITAGRVAINGRDLYAASKLRRDRK